MTVAAVGSGNFFAGGAEGIGLLEVRNKYSHFLLLFVQFAHVGLVSSH